MPRVSLEARRQLSALRNYAAIEGFEVDWHKRSNICTISISGVLWIERVDVYLFDSFEKWQAAAATLKAFAGRWVL